MSHIQVIVIVESPIKFSKRGRLGRTLIFRGGLLGEGGELFEGKRGGKGGFSFYVKNKLKPEIFNDKKG